MSMGGKIRKEIMEWGLLTIAIVLISVILLKFKGVSGVTAELNSTIDTIVAAMSEPKNWLVIVIVATIGFGLFGLFKYAKNKN